MLRESKGETQAELAKILLVKRETVNQWEQGTRDLKTQYTINLANHFGVSCDYLLGRSRAAAPDNFMQEVVTRYGLNEQVLQFLERLNTPLNIDDVEQDRIAVKQITFENSDSPFDNPPLTQEEFQTLIAVEQDAINKQALSALNEILTTATGNEWETYGFQMLTTIYNYCHRMYSDVEQITQGKTGQTIYTITADIQRNLELYTLNDILSRFRNELIYGKGGGKNGNGKKEDA